jgi:hypothetical protein
MGMELTLSTKRKKMELVSICLLPTVGNKHILSSYAQHGMKGIKMELVL